MYGSFHAPPVQGRVGSKVEVGVCQRPEGVPLLLHPPLVFQSWNSIPTRISAAWTAGNWKDQSVLRGGGTSGLEALPAQPQL